MIAQQRFRLYDTAASWEVKEMEARFTPEAEPHALSENLRAASARARGRLLIERPEAPS
jgi:hypothetical protein